MGYYLEEFRGWPEVVRHLGAFRDHLEEFSFGI